MIGALLQTQCKNLKAFLFLNIMKTNINKLRNPNFLGGWDLMDENGKTINRVLTIKEIKVEKVFNQKIQDETDALTLFFTEAKPMILNATNRKTLCKVLGTEFIEDMVGQKIELTTKKVKAFGEIHDAIRIVASKPTQTEPIQINVPAILEKLNACQNQNQLRELWSSLNKTEQTNTEIFALKEKLKTTLQ